MKVCGIDPSRSSLAVSFVEGMNEFDYKEYKNSPQGFSQFINDLNQLNPKPSVCIEGYGDFAKQLTLYLKHHLYKVYEVNPKMSRHLKDSITAHKTDHIDAYTCAISYFIRDMKELNVDGKMEGLKNLCRLYRKLSKETTSMKNQFHAALNQGFGSMYKEILPYMNNMAIVFYSHYGSIKEIQDSSVNEIHKVLGESGSCRYKGKHGLKRAKEIKELVKDIDVETIRAFTDIQSVVINGYAQALKVMLIQKEKIQKQIEKYVKRMFPDYKDYFGDIKGLTPLFFALLVSEGALTRNFENEEHFASYCGQAPRQFQSASMNKFLTNRNYNRYLASTIHFVACTNVQKQGMYHEDYQEAKKRFSKKLRALKRIKRKLVRVLFYKLMDYRLHLLTTDKRRAYSEKTCVA